MLASFYIQRQLSKSLGLSVNAEEIFYQVDTHSLSVDVGFTCNDSKGVFI